MRRYRTLMILGLITAAVVAGAILTRPVSPAIPGNGEPLFPELMPKINDVVEMNGFRGGQSFTARLENGAWVVPQKSGYPARQDKVRRLIVGIATLERLEPKTSDPDLYGKLGLDDPSAENVVPTRYKIKDGTGTTLAELTVGNRRASRTDPSSGEIYVRTGSNPQAWLVEGKLPVFAQTLDLIDPSILEIARERVREVRVLHPDGEQVLVSKNSVGERGFTLEGIPEGMKVKNDWAVNDIGRGLTGLRLDDVRPASDVDFEQAGLSVELVTFDGLRVTAETTLVDEKTFSRLTAEFVPELVRIEEAAQDSEPLQAEAVAEEAESLSKRWQGWVYQLSPDSVEKLAKKQSDLIEPIEEAEGEG